MRFLRVILLGWLLYFSVGTAIGLGLGWYRRRTLLKELRRLDSQILYYQSRLDVLEDPRYIRLLGLRYGYLDPHQIFQRSDH